MPIYFVICESVKCTPYGYYILHILNVIETTLEDVHTGKLTPELNQYYGTGMNIQSFIFEREPENPFRALTK